MGAKVTGYALAAPTDPSLFGCLNLKSHITSIHGDVRNPEGLASALRASKAEVVFHMAAQSLVLQGYQDPINTYSTNVMGTVNLLETVRSAPSVRAVVVVTSDKCYETEAAPNRPIQAFRETDPLGGLDPYSSSKACAELITRAYASSYPRGTNIATARAGNVIGGGDWAPDRLVPDIVRAWRSNHSVPIRNPLFVRPWQHVLEPLNGYLKLAQRMIEDKALRFSRWNFGPSGEDHLSVNEVSHRFQSAFPNLALTLPASEVLPPEDRALFLDSEKARQELKWKQRWALDQAIANTALWYKKFYSGVSAQDLCDAQINAFEMVLP